MEIELDAVSRAALYHDAFSAIEAYRADLSFLPVASGFDPEVQRSSLAAFDFSVAKQPGELVDVIVHGLRTGQTHVSSPRCFGLFVPAPTTMGIIGDLLAAAFNPQLANWSHAPFAVELEAHVLRAIGRRLGFRGISADGTFTTGGAESNHTALLLSLAANVPHFFEGGLASAKKQLKVYAGSEAHHSTLKAVRACGLGTRALRTVPSRRDGRMDPLALREMLAEDIAAGAQPLFVVATAGTTGSGLVDPLDQLACASHDSGAWYHVDAAWGGAAALTADFRQLFKGIECADSVSIDAHKWLSVPMGGGMLLCQRSGILDAAFSVSTSYMPQKSEDYRLDPYARSLQWSRRFIGLKVFLTIAAVGWDGLGVAIKRQVLLGDRLRMRLRNAGWQIVNDTPLPVVCFIPPENIVGPPPCKSVLEALVRDINESGEAWISTVVQHDGKTALRACISNFNTSESDVDALVEIMEHRLAEMQHHTRQPPEGHPR
jgi:glutamate/tyrosine decarboxylase-like PLP-dependent enzyme